MTPTQTRHYRPAASDRPVCVDQAAGRVEPMMARNAQPLTVRVWTERDLGTSLRILNLFIQTDTAVRDVRIVTRDDKYELRILLEPIGDRRLAALEAKILSMPLVDRAQLPAPTTPISQS